MGFIKTGMEMGAVLGGAKMLTNSYDKHQNAKMQQQQQMPQQGGQGGSYYSGPSAPMNQIPPHPLCNCPYCPQNQTQHPQVHHDQRGMDGQGGYERRGSPMQGGPPDYNQGGSYRGQGGNQQYQDYKQ